MDPREGRIAGRAVWAVALGSFVVQLVLGSQTRSWSWDEAIYLSQVTRGAVALPFVASRARGITVLVAPFTWLGAPGWVVRLALALASSALLAVVFRSWVPYVGLAAPAGAFLFAASWPAMFYGSEVMPNLWAALFGVGAAGYLVRVIEGGEDARKGRIGLVACAGSMALMRPPDALVLGFALSLTVLVFRREAWRSLRFLVAGAVVGWVPWLVEMSVRFGGPLEALRSAREVSHLTGGSTGVTGHLALTDGPLLGPDPSGATPIAGALWWTALLALIVVALVMERRSERALAVRLAVVGGIALALEYLVLVSGLAPRFLLPSLALVSLAAGCGLDALRRTPALGRTLKGALVVGIVVWTAWQVGTLRSLERRAAIERAVPAAVGEAIGSDLGAPTGACLIVSADDYPQVAFAARCGGRQLHPLEEGPDGSVVRADGDVVFVTRTPIAVEALGPEFEAMPSPAPGWFAYRKG